MTVWNGLPTWVTFSPLLGMLVLLFIPRQQNRWLKWVGMAGTLPPCILALMMFAQFDPKPGVYNLHKTCRGFTSHFRKVRDGRYPTRWVRTVCPYRLL